jgi:hypothetical protein
MPLAGESSFTPARPRAQISLGLDSTLRTEVLNDGKAGCLERAAQIARPGDSILLMREAGDPVGHALVRHPDGSVTDPNQPGVRYPDLGSYLATHPQYSLGASVPQAALQQVLQLPPGSARDARIAQLGLQQAADIRVADPIVTSSARARARATPDASTENTVDTFPANTPLQVLGQSGDYYLVTATYEHQIPPPGSGVEYVTTTGWVNKSLINPPLPSNVPALGATGPWPAQPGRSVSATPPEPPEAGISGDGAGSEAASEAGTGAGEGTGAAEGAGAEAAAEAGSSTGTVTGQQVVQAAGTFMSSNTSSYMNRCLNFVTTVLAQAGISDPLLIGQPSASSAMSAVQGAGRLNAWPANPANVPVGAVVFWSEPAPDGHAALFAGMSSDNPPRPLYITSPVGSMTMPGTRTITSLATDNSGRATPPAGYFLPDGLQQPVTVG